MPIVQTINRVLKYIIITVIVVWVTIYLVNYFLLQSPLNKVIKEDCRNQGLVALASFKHRIDYRVLVFDVRKIGKPGGPPAVFRALFQLSKELQDWKFEEVIIAYKGDDKFFLDGTVFEQLGVNYGHKGSRDMLLDVAQNLRFMNGDRVLTKAPGNYAALLQQELKSGSTQIEDSTNRILEKLTVQ